MMFLILCLISGTDFAGFILTVRILTGKLERHLNLHVGNQNAEHRRRAICGDIGHWDNGLD